MIPLHVPSHAGSRALEERSLVPWASLNHAYTGSTRTNPFTGERSAVRGPDVFLAELHDPSTEIREEALDELTACIEHQSDLYEATAYVVPFLCAVAADAPTEQERQLLVSLVVVAEATAYAKNASVAPRILEAYRASLPYIERLATRTGAPTVRTFLLAVGHGRPDRAFDWRELDTP